MQGEASVIAQVMDRLEVSPLAELCRLARAAERRAGEEVFGEVRNRLSPEDPRSEL